MNKKLIPLLMILTIFLLTSCGNKTLEKAQTAVNNYNNEISLYNKKIFPFNSVAQEIIDTNQALDDQISIIQSSMGKNSDPYKFETKIDLKQAINLAQESKVSTPDKLPIFKELTINERENNDDLKLLIEQSEKDIITMKSIVIPEIPKVPEYSEAILNIEEKRRDYEDSVQGFKQVNAPTDEFVINRLKRIDTIIEVDAVTENNDPNKQLNKQGGYIGCIYFSDKQVDKSKLYIEIDTVIEIATDGGGAVEIFKTVAEAKNRDTYLGGFDGGALSSGSHHVVGTVIIRTSRELTASQQNELTLKITDALLDIE